MGEPSSERLASELDRAGLWMLGVRARRDEFHDYRSPHIAPQHVLVEELCRQGGRAARALTERVTAGEFAATREESDSWMASPEGRRLARELLSEEHNASDREGADDGGNSGI